MREKILMPKWVNDFEFIKYSENISKFLARYNIEDIVEIDLNYLRDYFKKDRVSAINLIDELGMRGFEFLSNLENSILPKRIDNNIGIEYLMSKSCDVNYMQINFKEINCGNILQRFKINNDKFFDYIPIIGFRHLNKNINIEQVKKIFLSQNFLVISNNLKENFEDDSKKIKRVKVADFFKESTYGLFRKYCNEKTILFMDELNDFNFSVLVDYKGFGRKRICEIKEKYNLFSNEVAFEQIEQESKNINEIEYLVKNIHSDFQEIDISSLFEPENFIDKIILYIANNQKLTKMKELENLPLDVLVQEKGIGTNKIKEISNKLSKYAYSMEKFVEIEMLEIKTDKYYGYYREKAINRKKTYESMGQQSKLTRERVRQILLGVEKKLKKFLHTIENYMIDTKENKSLISLEDLENIFKSHEDAMVIKYCMENIEMRRLSYFKEINKFLIDKNSEETKIILNNILGKLPDIFNLFNKLDLIIELLIEEELEFIDVDDFETYMIAIGYKKKNDFYFKKAFSLVSLYNYILEYYFSDGLRLDQEGIKNIRNIAEKEFGIATLPDERAISARIEIENILRNKHTYIHLNNVKIQYELFDEIKRFVDDEMISKEAVPMEYLFEKFKDKLYENTTIDNKYYLYGVFRFIFENEFSFRRNFICKKENKNISTHEILEKYILENKIMSKKEIVEKFKWNEYTINQAVDFNNRLLFWKNGGYIAHVSSLSFSTELLKITKELLEGNMTEGYTNSKIIFEKEKFLFIKNGIEDDFSLFSFIETFLKDDFSFRRPHILREKSVKNFTTVDLILKIIQGKEKFSYKWLEKELKKLMIGEVMTRISFDKIKEGFLQISYDEFIIKEKINFDLEWIEEVNNKFKSSFERTEYIPLTEYSFYGFPPFEDKDLYWNEFLLKALIEAYFIQDYKLIKSQNDWRFEKIIVVKKTSALNNISDLIKYILKNEYTDLENMIVDKIEKYLKDKGVIHKSLPQEIFDSGILEVDEFGRIKLKDG